MVKKWENYRLNLLNKCPYGVKTYANQIHKEAINICLDILNIYPPFAVQKCKDKYFASLCCEECLEIYTKTRCYTQGYEEADYNCMNNCENFIDNPCHNGGKCINKKSDNGGFDCICKSGYSGN